MLWLYCLGCWPKVASQQAEDAVGYVLNYCCGCSISDLNFPSVRPRYLAESVV